MKRLKRFNGIYFNLSSWQSLRLARRGLVSVNKKQSIQTNVFFGDVIEFFLPALALDLFFTEFFLQGPAFFGDVIELFLPALALDVFFTEFSLQGPVFLVLPVVGPLSLNFGNFPANGALERLLAVIIMQILLPL